MSSIYTNLPQKEKDALEKSIDELKNNQYNENFEFNANDYDATVGFFVKRNFSRQSAEELAYVILQQAKIDSVPVMEILDVLKNSSNLTLSDVVSRILNTNRYKSSRVGVKNTKVSRDVVARNIIA
jgi:hypothetical protein